MGDQPDLCAANCSIQATPIDVETLEADTDKGDHFCTFYDENDCKFEFIYNDNDVKNITISAKSKLECPTEIFILGIVMGVIASIVLIGLALLFLWKILTTIHDRREFAKFEKERRSAKWDTVRKIFLRHFFSICFWLSKNKDFELFIFSYFQGENPIYKQATSTFKNPTYNGGR